MLARMMVRNIKRKTNNKINGITFVDKDFTRASTINLMRCNVILRIYDSNIARYHKNLDVNYMKIMQEFMEFIKEYKVMGIAVAFIMAAAATALVQSLVNDIVMPIITPFIPGGAWQTATLSLGPIVLKWGSFLGAVINFIILAFVVFMIAKMVLKEDKVAKK